MAKQSACHRIAAIKEEPVDVCHDIKSEAADVERGAGVIPTEEHTAEVVEDVRLLDAASMKQEMDIGLTVLQPPDMHFMLRPCKEEPADKTPQANHMPQHHGPTTYDIHCEQSMEKKSGNKQSHAETTHGCVKCNFIHKNEERPYSCEVRSKSYKPECQLIQLQNVHAGNPSNTCDISRKSLAQKLGKFKNIQIDGCSSNNDVCSKTFIQIKSSLIDHVNVDDGNHPYKCSVCSKTFTRKIHLINHMNVHTSDRPYKCDVCGKTFTQKSNINSHMNIHTGERPYKCDVCTRTFTQKRNLNGHMYVHTGERPYKCYVCTKTFIQKKHLNQHMNSHAGIRPYKCDVCTKTFTQKRNLNVHMYVHTGERPYKCDVCTKTFTQKRNLNVHMYVHTGERPYKCDVCTKTFTERRILNIHMYIHTGERPYKCDVCTKTFTQKSHLIRHNMNIHTVTRPYKCDLCTKTFKQKSNLNSHMNIHRKQKTGRSSK